MSAVARLDGAALLAHPITEAVLATIRELGFEEASVEDFVKRAGISRAEFHSHFSGKQEVTLLILESHIDRFVERVGRAYLKVETWPDNLRAAAYEVARYRLEYPDLIWLAMVGVLEIDDMARARRDQVFRWTADLIDAGRTVAPDPAAVPPAASMMAVGAVVETMRRRQAEGAVANVVANLPQMMYAVVKPYLGEEAARAELTIELPADLLALESQVKEMVGASSTGVS
ncbi:MAG TPA: TetR/AcrR family transcriptional regulator [Solirubrobacterales bacterium]|jgi:AcrR family transcriptional regulator|nr:TetR/AcrR family transcriptional regulator [Solirubrobacterales bacterium]